VLRPRLTAGFTVVPDGEAVWLVAGEDVRLALRGDAVGRWLPALLAACDGHRSVDDVVALAPAAHRREARELLDGLAGERVLVDGGAERAYRPQPAGWRVEGDGALAEALRGRAGDGELCVLAQDTLELTPALAVNLRRLGRGGAPWLWASIGPAARALVGPVFLPDAGPCLACLVDHFRLRSPVPALYDLIAGHPGPFAPAVLEPAALAVVADFVAWKLSLAAREPAPAALFALHVVEVATLEVSSHRVLLNPECPACATRGT
jgi:bacteriocin biosynthesis cyclodehydratase domain-containing protein